MTVKGVTCAKVNRALAAAGSNGSVKQDPENRSRPELFEPDFQHFDLHYISEPIGRNTIDGCVADVQRWAESK